jgi:hypothetical protein
MIDTTGHRSCPHHAETQTNLNSCLGAEADKSKHSEAAVLDLLQCHLFGIHTHGVERRDSENSTLHEATEPSTRDMVQVPTWSPSPSRRVEAKKYIYTEQDRLRNIRTRIKP